MAKKSFGMQLAQGFVRSTVNQVGRQTGNVIANNFYGNAHSVPHRNTGNMNYDKNTYLSEAIGEPTEPEYKKPTFLKYCLWFFLSLCIPIGSAITFFHGLFIYLSKNIKCFNYSTHEAFIDDRRYKEGVRSLGNTTIKNDLILPENECSQKIINDKKMTGIIYMCMGGVFLLLFIICAITN